jgi:N6-L-threonylcarbamoyladenine synthase
MLVLGIETTCDETACAIVQSGKKILSNVIASQASLHENYGGVYPELASRSHVDQLIPTLDACLKQAQVTRKDLSLIAVAKAPGLIGSIVIGLNAAKALSLAWNLPFIGVNHVEAHLYSAMMPVDTPSFPSLGLVLSGGHTFIVKIHSIGHYEMLGTTVDDALGEAFDKVAQLLQLPYPGGPSIEALAKTGDPKKYPFKSGYVKNKPFHFSFSGIKTNVLYALKGPNSDKHSHLIIEESEKKHIAASFQQAVFMDVIKKTLLAAKEHGCQTVFLGGGVTQSQTLRQLFLQHAPAELQLHYPPPGLSLDNGAMIAGLGFHLYKKNYQSDPLDLEALPRLPL